MSLNTKRTVSPDSISTVPLPVDIPIGTSPYIAESIRETRRRRDDLHGIMREIATRRSQPQLPQDKEARRLRKQEIRTELRGMGIPNRVAERRYQATTKARMKGSPATFDERVSRLGIILRDDSTCYLCNALLADDEIHLDHVIPISKGGSHTEDNLRVACKDCNTRKGAKLIHAA